MGAGARRGTVSETRPMSDDDDAVGVLLPCAERGGVHTASVHTRTAAATTSATRKAQIARRRTRDSRRLSVALMA